MMTKFQVFVSEQDVIKLVLEFLEKRKLHISQLSVERESGIINGEYSEDALFLRQLILDGQWDSALDFVDPLNSYPDFNARHFRYLILKYKYYELLCIKTEPGPMQNNEYTVDEVVECLHALEIVSPTPDDYRQLRVLLTLPALSEHDQFRHWNPSSARVECFNAVYPLVRDFLSPNDEKDPARPGSAKSERLLQLIIKGMVYEACVDFCQNKALNTDGTRQRQLSNLNVRMNKLLSDEESMDLSNIDLSLVGWLECLPKDAFGVQFVQKSLDLKSEALRRPQLEALWTEQILVTPIKPMMFPHAAVPVSRLKSAEKMSRSMIPQYEGLVSGLGNATPSFSSRIGPKNSARDSLLSQSIAIGFQLTGKQLMQQSAIDVLLDTSSQTRNSAGNPTAPAGLVLGGIEGYPSMQNSTVQQQSIYFPHQYQQPPQLAVIEETTPLGHAIMNDSDHFDRMTARQQLDDQIRRRSASPNVNQPKPELTRSIMSESTRQGGGRLYQEFKQQRAARCGSEPPGIVSPAMATDGLAYQMMNMSFYAQNPMDYQYAQQMGSPAMLASMRQMQRRPQRGSLDGSVTERQAAFKTAQNGSSISDDSGIVSYRSTSGNNNNNNKNVQFVAVNRLEDQQAIRAVSFHPSGRYFAVGTNSRQLHVCKYPEIKVLRSDHVTKPPETLLLRPKQHRGSVYCVGFNPTGELLASGSNDKAVRLMKFDAETCKIGPEFELTMHDGTVRDLVFMEDTSNRTSLLISGGAGNCRIHLTDCATGMGLRQLYGHTAPVLGLYTWGGCMFVSCSQDKTIRFWDLRCAEAVNMIAPSKATSSSPVTSICVDPSGRLLVSGHEDASIMLYDMRGSHVVQLFRPHVDEVRTVRFSPGTYYLLSGSYDKKIVITDIRGNLLEPLKYLPVAEHEDKVIQCRWHPHDFTFLSTSADRSVILWALPPPEMID